MPTHVMGADPDVSELEGRMLYVDTETTGLRVYQDDTVRTVQVAPAPYRGPDTPVYVWTLDPALGPVGNLDVLTRLLKYAPALGCHRYPFDGQAMRTLGWQKRPEQRIFDTKLIAWLADENVETGLKERVEYLGGDPTPWVDNLHWVPTQKGGRRKRTAAEWASASAEVLVPYAAADPIRGLYLFDHYRDIAESSLYTYEERVLILTDEMIQRGMPLDVPEVERLLVECREKQAAARERIPVGNPNSHPQVRELLYKKWKLTPPFFTEPSRKYPEGQPSTDITALLILRTLEGLSEVRGSILDALIEYRHESKLETSFLAKLPGFVAADGRIHAGFLHYGTVTGRDSCSMPNLQQLPKEGGLRSAFPGVVAFDLSQAELRVGAYLSGDTAMLRALESGDPHQNTMERTGMSRKHAKNQTYGKMYGAGPTKLARMSVKAGAPTTEREAARQSRQLNKLYRKLYGAIRVWQDEYGDTEMPVGVHGRVRRYAGKDAWNSKVQGTIAEVVKGTCLRLGHYDLIARVHDEIVFDERNAPPADEVAEACADACREQGVPPIPCEQAEWK